MLARFIFVWAGLSSGELSCLTTRGCSGNRRFSSPSQALKYPNLTLFTPRLRRRTLPKRRNGFTERIGKEIDRSIIDFLEFEWECDVCGSHAVSRHPDCPPNGRFGKNVYVQTTLMKYEERLPLRKVQSIDRWLILN